MDTPAQVGEVIDRWHSAMVSPEAVAFAREVVRAARPASAPRAKALLFAASRLGEWAGSVGLALVADVVLCPSVTERFVVANAGRLSAPTARTLRTNCRALARALQAHPAPLALALPRERAKEPYTQKEISAYLALALAQPTASRAARASALVCLGAGAGLVGAELAAVRGTDVGERWGGALVAVCGRRARTVPVLAALAPALLTSAAMAGEAYLLGGTARSRRNVASGLVASLARGAGLPRLELGRLRATWLAEVAGGIGLRAFMDAAGIECSQRLGDIVARLSSPTEAEAVRLLGARGC